MRKSESINNAIISYSMESGGAVSGARQKCRERTQNKNTISGVCPSFSQESVEETKNPDCSELDVDLSIMQKSGLSSI